MLSSAIQTAKRKHILDSAKIEKKVGPHDLRHSMTTLLLAAREPVEVASSYLGHATPAPTLTGTLTWWPEQTGKCLK